MVVGPDPVQAVPSRLSFGFSYEDFVSRLYRAVVQLGEPTRAALKEQGYDDEDLDVGLRELLARGFITTTEDPDRWEVVSPRAAVAAYAAEMDRQMALARSMMGPLDMLWRQSGAPAERREMPLEVDLLVGVDVIAEHVRSLHREASGRLWWAVDASPASRSLLARAATDPDLLAVAPGVEARFMLDTSLLDDDAALTHLHRAGRAGHQVRVGSGVPFSALLVDDAALVDLSSFDPEGVGSFETRLAPTLAAVGRLLEEIFVLSTPYGPTAAVAVGDSAVPLDERDQQILALLTVGASDQLVARQLGVSVRTVERRVRYLMEHLGSATRFQAGVQAVRRGGG